MGMTEKALPTKPARDMYAALAVCAPLSLRAAFVTVVDMIDAGTLPPEIVAEVVIGLRPLAEAMDDLAEVDYGACEETIADAETMIADCKAAADALRGAR